MTRIAVNEGYGRSAESNGSILRNVVLQKRRCRTYPARCRTRKTELITVYRVKRFVELLGICIVAGVWMTEMSAEAEASSPANETHTNWTRGTFSDPKFFPLAVWLQSPANAARYRAAGINTFVALWKGPTEEQLKALKSAGMKV